MYLPYTWYVYSKYTRSHFAKSKAHSSTTSQYRMLPVLYTYLLLFWLPPPCVLFVCNLDRTSCFMFRANRGNLEGICTLDVDKSEAKQCPTLPICQNEPTARPVLIFDGTPSSLEIAIKRASFKFCTDAQFRTRDGAAKSTQNPAWRNRNCITDWHARQSSFCYSKHCCKLDHE